MPPRPRESRCGSCAAQGRTCPVGCSMAPIFPRNNKRVKQNSREICGVFRPGLVMNTIDESNLKQTVEAAFLFEAEARVRDPEMGLVGLLATLSAQVDILRNELVQNVIPLPDLPNAPNLADLGRSEFTDNLLQLVEAQRNERGEE